MIQSGGNILKIAGRVLKSFYPFRTFRLKRKGADAWEAVGEDPLFWFTAPPRCPCDVYFFLDALDGYIQPELFLDWGDGFDESEKISCGNVQTALIRLRVDDTDGLKKIRLDPSKNSSSFRIEYGLVWGGDQRVENKLLDARARGRVAARKDVVATDYAPSGPGRSIGRKRRSRDAHENYQKIVHMAETEFAAKRSPSRVGGPPQFSLIAPVFNAPASYLDFLLRSILQQAPGIAELVVSDDGSTSPETLRWLESHKGQPGLIVIRNATNLGIASALNEGLSRCTGQWIGFVDHDDALAPFALDIVSDAIRTHAGAKLIYTDEAIADENMRVTDFFLKPAFDPVLLSGMNYMNHLCLFRRDRLTAIQGLRLGLDGSQDYDLLLRYVADLNPEEVLHVPYPAYLWRRDGRTFSIRHVDKATANARAALGEAYMRSEKSPPIEEALSPYLHRVRFDHRLQKSQPKVSVVIPNKNSHALLACLLDGLSTKTDYDNFEIIVVDNGSTDNDVLGLYDNMRAGRIPFRLHMEPAPFNFSRQVNTGMRLATGDLVLPLNNDIEIVESGWLKEMVGCFSYARAGVVGARLLYPDQTIQHAGVIVGLGDFAGHWFVGRPAECPGPLGRLHVRSTLTAVTGACMLISRDCIETVGQFDEEGFAIAYNDIDFCIRAGAAGFSVIYTPFAKLVHHEAASRGVDERGVNRPRFLRDQAMLLERHRTEGFVDRAYSPWWSRDSSEPRVKILDRLPAAR